MKHYKLSIIVPAYNAADYLANAIDCLLKQTLEDIEIISVDDCSKDETLKVANNLALANPNIKVIHHEKNAGAGAAKNTGIAAAQADYIGFCDADDGLPLDYYERLYYEIIDKEADIACCNLCLVYENGNRTNVDLLDDNCVLDRYGRIKYLSAFKKGESRIVPNEVMMGHWSSSAAPIKVFKRDLIKKYAFYTGVCDDIPAVLPAIAKAKKIVYIPDLYYDYVQRSGSLERADFSDQRLGVVDAVCETVSRVVEDGNSEYAPIIIHNHLFPTIVNFFRQIPSEKRKEAFSIFYEKLLQYPDLKKYWDFMDSNPYVKNTIKKYPLNHRNAYVKAIRQVLNGEIEELADTLQIYDGQLTNVRPLVSIIIPVYNGANYMREAINSALTQDYPNVEVIVVNDGSKDNGETDRIAKSYGNRIRYISKPNGGVSTALNAGIKAMNGEYFSWLSHDDLYMPNKISRQMELVLQQKDRKTILIGGVEVFDGLTGTTIFTTYPSALYPKHRLNKPLFGVFHGLINGCAMLIHKSHFERVGMFDASLKTTQDYDMWFRLLRKQKALYHDDVLIRSRSHPGQESRASYHQDECFRLWKRLMDETTKEERIAMSDSELNFFKQIYTFLTVHTPYKEAAAYAKQRYAEVYYDKLKKNSRGGNVVYLEFAANGLHKVIPCLSVQEIKKILCTCCNHNLFENIVFISHTENIVAERMLKNLRNTKQVIAINLNASNSSVEYSNQHLDINIPVADIDFAALNCLVHMIGGEKLLFNFDNRFAGIWKTWGYNIKDYVTGKVGFLFESTYDFNLPVFQLASKVDFVNFTDEESIQIYSAAYRNLLMFYSPSASNLLRAFEGNVQYYQANAREERGVIQKLIAQNVDLLASASQGTSLQVVQDYQKTVQSQGFLSKCKRLVKKAYVNYRTNGLYSTIVKGCRKVKKVLIGG